MEALFWQRVRTVSALMHRDLKVMKGSLVNTIVNGGIFIALQAFIYGHLFPIIGMNSEIATSMCIGQFIIAINILSFLIAEKVAFDLNSTRFIEYHLGLPLPKRWLFGQYIARFFVETFVATIPLFLLGGLVLGPHLRIIATNWFALIIIYLLTCLFFAVLFLALSISLSFRWFIERMWSCILAPLMMCSSLFFDWHSIKEASPFLAKLFLCNPVTYIAEGFRSSVIGSTDYISTVVCVPVIAFATLMLVAILAYGINNRLDPV